MTSRTSYWVGLLLSATTAISASQLLLSAQADTLKITGPNGEVKQARQYGPTTPSDTFWSIAQKVRPNDRITIYQVMSALFDANPHAFSDNNYNSLEKGMILAIPSAEVMAAIPKAQAKLRAERDDRLARTAKPAVTPKPSVNTNVVKQVQAKPVTPEKPLQITPQQPVVANVEPLSAAKKNEMAELNNELDKANNKTLMLTDELARAQDQLMATRSDNQVLKQKVEELTQIISNLEEDVQLQLEKHQLLVNKNEMLATELEEANKPAIEQPTDFWRNLTNNTGLLIAAAALPILLLFGVIFLILRRRANAKDDPKSAPETVSEPNAAASDANNDNDLEDLAVHLDSDDEESIDDLLDLDSLDMQPETELHIDDDQMDMAAAMFIEEPDTAQEPVAEEDDDVTSLDDLWAEAMEEQDSELDPLETDEDLDNLLAGLDDDDLDEPAVSAAPEDDLDALLANIDNEQPADIIDEVKSSSVSSEQDNIDDLLAGFEMSADDVDEPETLSDNPDSNNVNEDDIDSLLAGFDVDDSEAVSKSSENDESIANIPADTEADDDIDALLASFETQKTSEEPEDDDIDALLASFDAQDDNETQDAPSTAEHNSDDDNEDLADAIAAELELDDDLANKDVDVAEDDDIDALLASFNAQDANETQDAPSTEDSSEDDNEDLADAIAAELESDDDLANKDVDVAEDDDIDALLASFDAQDANETQDAASAASDSEYSAADDSQAIDSSGDDNEDLADAIAAELESDDDLVNKDVAEDDDIDALLASFDAQDANETQDAASAADSLEEDNITDNSEDLSEAITAERESVDEQGSEPPLEGDGDLDALLASFDSDETDTQTDDLTDEILDFEEVPENDQRLDSLLADLELASMEDEADDSLSLDIIADDESDDLTGLISELEQAQAPTVTDDDLDLNTLESELLKAGDVKDAGSVLVDDIDDSILSDAESELDALLANMGTEADDLSSLKDDVAVDFDPLTFETDSASELDEDAVSENKGTNVKVEKDSGFFNDLKAAKKPQENMLDWETDIFNSASKLSSSQKETIPNLQTNDDVDFSDDDLTEFTLSDDFSVDDEFVLDDDTLTVDEALAALDKEEGDAVSLKITEAELSNFERENGFIDINKLLNDADEGDVPVLDNYKDVDVDMGGVGSLLGNTNMVDVDDEENSVNAKLDLARAYIEIEDEDSAKALLKEVQNDGNSRQQAEANSLLKKLT